MGKNAKNRPAFLVGTIEKTGETLNDLALLK
jgi:hypothetical protein